MKFTKTAGFVFEWEGDFTRWEDDILPTLEHIAGKSSDASVSEFQTSLKQLSNQEIETALEARGIKGVKVSL